MPRAATQQQPDEEKDPRFCGRCGHRLSQSWGAAQFDLQTGKVTHPGELNYVCRGGYVTDGCYTRYFKRDGHWVEA